MEQPTGKMSLTFRRRGDGTTYLAQQYFKLPLQVMPPHYQDEDGTAFVYLLNPGGGILQHDRLLTEITAEEESRVLVTTPSSTKFYKMDEGCARVRNCVTVGKGAVVEYLPEYNVAFAEASAYQETDFYLEEDSVLLASDLVTTGRVSRGEIFQYNLYASKTRIYVDGKLKVFDSSRIEPKKMEMGELGMMEGALSNGTIYVYAPGIGDDLAEELNRLCAKSENIRFAAGLIEKNLMIIRFLGDSMIDLQDTVFYVWNHLRKKILGKPAVRIRKY